MHVVLCTYTEQCSRSRSGPDIALNLIKYILKILTFYYYKLIFFSLLGQNQNLTDCSKYFKQFFHLFYHIKCPKTRFDPGSEPVILNVSGSDQIRIRSPVKKKSVSST